PLSDVRWAVHQRGSGRLAAGEQPNTRSIDDGGFSEVEDKRVTSLCVEERLQARGVVARDVSAQPQHHRVVQIRSLHSKGHCQRPRLTRNIWQPTGQGSTNAVLGKSSAARGESSSNGELSAILQHQPSSTIELVHRRPEALAHV